MKRRLLNDLRTGLYHLPASRRRRLLEQAARTHQTVLEADIGGSATTHDALLELGKAFIFPDWYGANLDALRDCLTDPEWQPDTPLALLVSGVDALRRNDPEIFPALLEVLRSAAELRTAENAPLCILIDAAAPGIADLPEA